MKAERSEVVDIFRKWFAEKRRVCWEGRFPKFEFRSWGKIAAVSDNELRLIDLGSDSELVIQFGGLEFGYADSRVVTGEEKQFEHAIVMFFGPVPDEGEPDSIVVGALRQD